MPPPKATTSRIIELCCSKPKSSKELASALGVSESLVNKRMKELVWRGQIQRKYLDMKHPVYGVFEVKVDQCNQ
jgi:predicted ArsR family transcriptional regulator